MACFFELLTTGVQNVILSSFCLFEIEVKDKMIHFVHFVFFLNISGGQNDSFCSFCHFWE